MKAYVLHKAGGIETFGPASLEIEADSETVLYVRTDGKYEINP